LSKEAKIQRVFMCEPKNTKGKKNSCNSVVQWFL